MKKFLIITVLLFALPALAAPAVKKHVPAWTLQEAMALYKSLISRQHDFFQKNGRYAQSFKELSPGSLNKGRVSYCDNWCWVIPGEQTQELGFKFNFKDTYCKNWCKADRANNPQCVYYQGFYFCINAGKNGYKMDFFDIHNGPYLSNGSAYGAEMADKIVCGHFDCASLGASPDAAGIYYMGL